MLVVACSNKETARRPRHVQGRCIGCGLCAKQTDLFAVKDTWPKWDYTKYAPRRQPEPARTKMPNQGHHLPREERSAGEARKSRNPRRRAI